MTNAWQPKLRAFGQVILRDEDGNVWWELLLGILMNSVIFTIFVSGLLIQTEHHVSNEILFWTPIVVFTVLFVLVLCAKWCEMTAALSSPQRLKG